ncbi:MAG: hypothetical protein ACFFCO_10600 [Promethearchaeota archaeon]
MTKYRKAPDGEWPGYPYLKLDDIKTKSIRHNRYVAESLVRNRMGRVVLQLEGKLYQQFLAKVRERKGDIRAHSVNEAVQEAVKEWMQKE